MSRARRVFMTGFWSVGVQGTSVLTQLIAVPFFLKAWSSGTYDDWIALSALASMLLYADGGMQLHVVNLLTQSATQERWGDFRRDLASALLMYTLAGAVGLLGTAGLCVWLQLSGHFSGRALEHQAVAIAALLGAQVTAQLLAGFFGGLYRAFGRADLMQLVSFLQRTGLLVGTIGVLWLRRGALALAAVQLFIHGVAVLWQALDVRYREPRIAYSFRGADLRRAWGFLGPSLRYLFVGVAQGLTNSGTIIVIDAIAPTALVQFSTTRTVANSVRQIIGLVTNSVWPELTRLDAEGSREKLALANRLLIKLTSTVALPVIATLFFVGIPLYQVWTRGRAEPNLWLLRLLLLDVLITAPWLASTYVLLATSRIREMSRLYVLGGIVHVGLCVVAVKLTGVTGVGLVLIALSIGLFGVLIPRWSMHVVGETLGEYFRSVLLPYFLLALPTFAAAWAASSLALPWMEQHTALGGLSAWASARSARIGPISIVLARSLIVAAAAAGTTALISWRLLLRGPERKLLARSIRGILGRPAAPEAGLSGA